MGKIRRVIAVFWQAHDLHYAMLYFIVLLDSELLTLPVTFDGPLKLYICQLVYYQFRILTVGGAPFNFDTTFFILLATA